ncbi:unnamed protein product [Caenorhabditis bovis]|uniref:Transthyretin-like family protein n=1 Tax=Caenorhabditis bovis TaxID=2654633 RepID=A0A8S1F0H8_9PELO|nr:unnamed protein product [Caenorhabditis bovis]
MVVILARNKRSRQDRHHGSNESGYCFSFGSTGMNIVFGEHFASKKISEEVKNEDNRFISFEGFIHDENHRDMLKKLWGALEEAARELDLMEKTEKAAEARRKFAAKFEALTFKIRRVNDLSTPSTLFFDLFHIELVNLEMNLIDSILLLCQLIVVFSTTEPESSTSLPIRPFSVDVTGRAICTFDLKDGTTRGVWQMRIVMFNKDGTYANDTFTDDEGNFNLHLNGADDDPAPFLRFYHTCWTHEGCLRVAEYPIPNEAIDNGVYNMGFVSMDVVTMNDRTVCRNSTDFISSQQQLN